MQDNTFVESLVPEPGRWTEGSSIDGKGTFAMEPGKPMGEEPMLAAPRPDSGAQAEQMMGSGLLSKVGL